jgi:phosphoribosylpyrophosphate synthetase/predicted flap endonuclease-1-like 5' DNA nuclease
MHKPADELSVSRETPENRKLNQVSRELLCGAIVRYQAFSDTLFTRVDMSGADFRGSNFEDVYFSYSTLDRADLRGADLTGCKMSWVSFAECDLRNADIQGASLFHANLTNADLSGANLSEVNLEETEQSGANIESARRPVEDDSGERDTAGAATIEERGSSSQKAWDLASLSDAVTLDLEDLQRSKKGLVAIGYSETIAIKYVRLYVSHMLVGDGLFAIDGVGPEVGASLMQMGINTVEDLRLTSKKQISRNSELSKRRISRIKKSAAVNRRTALEPDDTRVAKQIIEEARTSSGRSNRNAPVRQSQTQREHNRPDQSDPEKGSTREQKATETTPSTDESPRKPLSRSLKRPDDEEHVVPGTGAVYPNRLSEYYEAFRSARKALELVFKIPLVDIDIQDRRDPRVQYFILLDACIGYGDSQQTFYGYGPQHQDRVAFTVNDYRDAFGNSQTVTDYQLIEVEPFAEETLQFLESEAGVQRADTFVRPCVPETGQPLMELPGTLEDLEETIHRLATFPAYPPLPSEEGASERTIPIADIYQTCFADLDLKHRVELGPIDGANSPPTGPVPGATPTTPVEAESKVVDYGQFWHLYKRVHPKLASPVERVCNIFALDWYRPSSRDFNDLRDLAKYGRDDPVDTFRPRLRDLVHRRILLDPWKFDYITVYPGHRAGSLSDQLVELAREAVVETEIPYSPLLERTETVERQRGKSEAERQQVALRPFESLKSRTKLHDKTIILFDDICTTGSSLLAGSHVLREAGAKRVVCITLGVTAGNETIETRRITEVDATVSGIIAGVD